MDNKFVISAEHLVKKFGKGETEVIALNDVSLKVHRGEFVSVTGESGSGKSTLLNILGTLDKPTSGKVFVENGELTAMNDDQQACYRRKNAGFVFQSYNLIPVLTVEENIVVSLNLDNTPPDLKYLDELLAMTGLEEKRYRFPNELSGGQQQRVAFVRALIHKPQIILADEPTGNLDNKNSREIITVLKNSIKKYNQALVMVTHDMRIASQADTVYVMDDGVISGKGNDDI